MLAKSAFVNITIRVRVSCVIWTRSNTGTATNAFIMFNQNNSAFDYMACSCRATTNTWCIYAMIASLRSYLHLQLGIGSIKYLNYPVAAISYWYIVFSLTGYNTIAASDALSGINCHCVSHDATSFSAFSVKNVTKLLLIPVPPINGSTRTFVISWVSLMPRPKQRFICVCL